MKPHKKLTAFLCAAIFSTFITFPNAATANEKQEARDISVKAAYAFATAPKQKNGAAFVVLENNGKNDMTITKATARVSEFVELHTHIMNDGVMSMREVESFSLPAGETLTLKPHGDHIMLMSLFTALQAGDSFPLTLHFDDKTHLKTDVSILKAGEIPAMEEQNAKQPVHEESAHEGHDMETDPEAAMDMEYHDMENHEEGDSTQTGE